jgi:hypothetical protein
MILSWKRSEYKGLLVMQSAEILQRLEKLEKQMSYALGNQMSILEQQEQLNRMMAKYAKNSCRKSEFAVMLNYFLLSLVFYGLLQ